jgi:hypothetical protein
MRPASLLAKNVKNEDLEIRAICCDLANSGSQRSRKKVMTKIGFVDVERLPVGENCQRVRL